MESEISLIEIDEADDSLFAMEEEICKSGTLDLGCSPLHLPISPPPNASQSSKNLNESNLEASNSISDQMKKRKKRGGFNLRKSLAWNNAFFTEEGVLNQQELTRLSLGGAKLNEDQELIGGLNDRHDNFLFQNLPLNRPSTNTVSTVDLKSSRKMITKSLLQAGGCPRPRRRPPLASDASSSQKRLQSMDLRNASTKDLKIPKPSLLKSKPSLASTVPKLAALGSKHPTSSNKTQGNLETNASAKGSSTASGITPPRIASGTRSSVQLSGKNMASRASVGLKVKPDSVPTFGVSSSRAAIPSQNANKTGEKFPNAQTHPTKPSGLRKPSPSLRYFGQPQAAESRSVKSPKATQSRILREVSILSQRKFGGLSHTAEMEPSHKPAETVKTPEVALKATTCLMPSAVTMASHPSMGLNEEFNRSVMNTLQCLPHVNYETKSYGVIGPDNSIEHQRGEEAHGLLKSGILVDIGNRKEAASEVPQIEEHRQRVSDECEKAQQKESNTAQENSVRFVKKRASEEYVKFNGFGDSRGNDSKNNISSVDTEITVSSHVNISDGELKRDLEFVLQSDSIERLQKDDHIENSIDVHPENEECNASELQFSHVAPLFDSEKHNFGVSGASFPFEEKHIKDIKESLKGSTVLDSVYTLKQSSAVNFEYESVAKDNCIESDKDDTLLWGQEELQDTIVDQVGNVEHQEHCSSPRNNGGVVEHNNSLEMSLGDSKGNESEDKILSKDTEIPVSSSHGNISDGNLERELENALQSDSIYKLQKDHHIEHLIDIHPENEECTASESEIFQVAALFGSDRRTSGVSGACFPFVQKHTENIIESSIGSKVLESIHILKPWPTVKFEYESVVHGDCFKAGKDCTLLKEHEGLKETTLDQVENVEHMEHHNTLKNDGGIVEQNNYLEVSLGDSSGIESKINISFKDTEITFSQHGNISADKLERESENALENVPINNSQKDVHIENFVDVHLENEDCNASESQISQVAGLFDSEKQTSGVSGASFPFEQKHGTDMRESSKGSTVHDSIHMFKPSSSVKFGYESVVHDGFFEAGKDDKLLREQEELKESILDQVENIEPKKHHNPPKNKGGMVEENNSLEMFLGDDDYATLTAEERCESENSELPAEDECAMIPLKCESLEDSRQDAVILKHNAVPFSDEWLAALEKAGEDILTRKTGAVQNSPPDKTPIELGPWSPVKRTNIPEIGPFDCTKYTSLTEGTRYTTLPLP